MRASVSDLRRRCVLVALIGAGALTTVGCAQSQPNVAVSAKPSSDEMPSLQRSGRTFPANVTVEGRAHESRADLLPSFDEPELTPAEKAALGPDPVHFKFLQYNELSLPLGSHVSPLFGGVATGSSGRGGASVLVGQTPRGAGSYGWGGAYGGVDPLATRVWGVYRERPRAGFGGPPSGVSVHIDPASSHVARRKTHQEP